MYKIYAWVQLSSVPQLVKKLQDLSFWTTWTTQIYRKGLPSLNLTYWSGDARGREDWFTTFEHTSSIQHKSPEIICNLKNKNLNIFNIESSFKDRELVQSKSFEMNWHKPFFLGGGAIKFLCLNGWEVCSYVILLSPCQKRGYFSMRCTIFSCLCTHLFKYPS